MLCVRVPGGHGGSFCSEEPGLLGDDVPGQPGPRSTSQMAETSGVPRPGVKKLPLKARQQINTLDFADRVIFVTTVILDFFPQPLKNVKKHP